MNEKVLVLVLIFTMKFYIILGQNEVISCRYFVSSNNYACDLTIKNTNGWNNFTEIAGTHLINKTNEDIRSVSRVSGSSTKNVPSIICYTFEFTTRMELKSIGIEHISEYSFQNCKKLIYVGLGSNNITQIDGKSFNENLELKTLYLSSNQLSTFWLHRKLYIIFGP